MIIPINTENAIFDNSENGTLRWSSSGFETRLQGAESVTLLYDLSDLPEKRCREENFAPMLFVSESDVTIAGNALSDGADNSFTIKTSLFAKSHALKFIKAGEYGTISNIRLSLPDGAAVERPERKKRKRIFFIGDSMTAGLYNRRIQKEDPPYYLPSSQNSELSYASICAKNLGMDKNIYAISGAPLNFMNNVFFERVSDDIPDYIVILLGTNDVRGSEGPWDVRKNRFVSDYRKFLSALQIKYPKSPIICLAGLMNCDYVPFVKSAAEAENVFFLPLPPLPHSGHPRVSEQEKTAKLLMEFIFKNNLI